jgi:hypothetical protein
MSAHPSTELQPIVRTPKPGGNPVSVHLKIEDGQNGLVATISRRDGIGKVIGKPRVFLVESKEEAKQQAKILTRSLGLRVYGFVDETVTRDALRPS